MRIILEGPDGSGKTTLGLYLKNSLNNSYFYRSGKPDTLKDFIIQKAELEAIPTSTEYILIDRTPAISEKIYSKVLNKENKIKDSFLDSFLKDGDIIIYCNTQEKNPSKEFKSYKSEDFLNDVIDKSEEISSEYEKIISELKNKYEIIHYDFMKITPRKILNKLEKIHDNR